MTAMERVNHLDLAICRHANRACAYTYLRRLFAVASWLGDGKFWYALMVGVALTGGPRGLALALHMAFCGVLGVLVYKLIKHGTHRPRPFVNHESIVPGVAPLDQFSFPSGHTLHAVMFTILACSTYPALAWVLVPFTALVATSRVILGLHYPTDVLLGALIGASLAWWLPELF